VGVREECYGPARDILGLRVNHSASLALGLLFRKLRALVCPTVGQAACRICAYDKAMSDDIGRFQLHLAETGVSI